MALQWLLSSALADGKQLSFGQLHGGLPIEL
jgi:hypothetical protein